MQVSEDISSHPCPFWGTTNRPVISIIPAESQPTPTQQTGQAHRTSNQLQPQTERPANTGWTIATEVEARGFREAPLLSPHDLNIPDASDAADERHECKLGQLADMGKQAAVDHPGGEMAPVPVVWHQALSAPARAARLQLQRQGWEELAQALSAAEVGQTARISMSWS